MAQLIETVRVRNGVAPLWAHHLERVQRSCLDLAVPLPDLEEPEGGDRVVRFEMGARGVTITERPVPIVSPVTLLTSTVPHPGYPHKTTDRAAFDTAFMACHARRADDALLLADGGIVAETTIWSLFWWDGEALAGPPLNVGILPGVARARIEELRGPIVEQRITPAVAALMPMFAANAVRGVVPVVELDGLMVPTDGRTDALSRIFWG